ncbi:hypothetical protein PLIIFM63780_003393 [Purpureocillium lilacinum]|nr:hypothetical protein PLIIFM63780_003393 [Purpureocillium lilacinum]
MSLGGSTYTSPPSPTTISRSVTPATQTPCSLNVADLELLHHFTTCTAQSLAGSDSEDDPIARFWSRNVPKLGLDHHFVLHLLLAVAGYHLAHMKGRSERAAQPYLSLAERHTAVGLTEFARVLGRLDSGNCQALYVSAMLVCYCTFAAGPTSPEDVLVCHLDDGAAQWLPLIKGVRLINETVGPDVLFSGLMAPLAPSGESEDTGAKFARDGFPRVDWEKPLDNLRDLVSSSAGESANVCLEALGGLSATYAAIYGRGADGFYDGPQSCQFVFGWLYRIQDAFVALLRRREAPALAILAYFAVLLRTLDDCWFVHGWCSHIVESVCRFVGPDYAGCLQWAVAQATQSD